MLDDFLDLGAGAEARSQQRLTTIADAQVRRTLEKTAGAKMDAFVDDAKILEFARRWGVLGICQRHERPGCSLSDCFPEQLDNFTWREPFSLWHGIILRALAMQRIGESINQGEPGSKSDWKQLIIEDRSEPSVFMRDTGTQHWGQPWRSKRSARQRLSQIMSGWLYVGNISARFGWEADHWAIYSVPGTGLWPLFGYLALYLALAVAGGRQAAFCYFCGKQYFPNRRPSPGQQNCCGDPDCKRSYWRENKRHKK